MGTWSISRTRGRSARPSTRSCSSTPASRRGSTCNCSRPLPTRPYAILHIVLWFPSYRQLCFEPRAEKPSLSQATPSSGGTSRKRPHWRCSRPSKGRWPSASRRGRCEGRPPPAVCVGVCCRVLGIRAEVLTASGAEVACARPGLGGRAVGEEEPQAYHEAQGELCLWPARVGSLGRRGGEASGIKEERVLRCAVLLLKTSRPLPSRCL